MMRFVNKFPSSRDFAGKDAGVNTDRTGGGKQYYNTICSGCTHMARAEVQ